MLTCWLASTVVARFASHVLQTYEVFIRVLFVVLSHTRYFFPKGCINCRDSFLTWMGVLDVLLQFCLGLGATIIATLAHMAKASVPSVPSVSEVFAASNTKYPSGLWASLSRARGGQKGIKAICHCARLIA